MNLDDLPTTAPLETFQKTFEHSSDEILTKKQKQKVIAILFGRLLKMHKSIMIVMSIVHMVIIVCIIVHMFTLGTIESENKMCFITWPLMHIFYAFVNYVFVWFSCYNSCEIGSLAGHDILRTS